MATCTPSSTVGHQKRRGIEQTLVWCHHCSGWCFAKHPGRSPAKKDTESQAINKWIVQCLHKQRPFSGPPIYPVDLENTIIKKNRVEQLKEKGNKCVQDGNFAEAVLHYTHAINQDSRNHLLFSNRSLCFLKLHQYFYAMEDAKETIKLKPDWTKGFYRKGEVEFAVGNYTLAIMAYKQAELLDPTNQGIKDAILKTTKEVNRKRKEERRQPWLYGGSGLLVGFVIVLADQFLTDKPSIENIILQILLVIVFGAMGLLILKTYRFVIESQQNSLLDEPVDLLKAMNGEDESSQESNTESKQTEKKPHRKGGTGAARQRYKIGKT